MPASCQPWYRCSKQVSSVEQSGNPCAESVASYLRTLCAPLLNEDQVASLTIDHAAGAFPGDHVYRVRVRADAVGFLLGRNATNADAVRTLTRAHVRAIGWAARVDVRISAL